MFAARTRSLGLLLFACLAWGTGCTGQTPAPAPQASTGLAVGSAPAVVPIEMIEHLDAVEQAMAPTDTDVVSSGAMQAFEVDPDGRVQVTRRKDVAAIDLRAGRYTLTVYCAGDGSLMVEFRIGITTQAATAGCEAGLVTTALVIDLSEPGEAEMSVDVDPGGYAVAAFGYRIQMTPL